MKDQKKYTYEDFLVGRQRIQIGLSDPKFLFFIV